MTNTPADPLPLPDDATEPEPLEPTEPLEPSVVNPDADGIDDVPS